VGVVGAAEREVAEVAPAEAALGEAAVAQAEGLAQEEVVAWEQVEGVVRVVRVGLGEGLAGLGVWREVAAQVAVD
jgi:hypothetical protein